MILVDKIKNLFSQETIPFEEKNDKTAIKTDHHYDGYEYYHTSDFGWNLTDFKDSVDLFLNPYTHSRVNLQRIYTNIIRYDSQISACILQRKKMLLQGDLQMTVNGKELVNTDINGYVYDFIDIVCDSIFRGVEVAILDFSSGKLEIHKVNEENVDPIEKVILRNTIDQYNIEDSVSYKYGKLSSIAIEIGKDKRDLGLLSSTVQYVMAKPLSVWTAHANRFSMLTRVLKTSDTNAAKMKAGYKMLQNQMKNNFIILGEQDELSFEGDSRSNITIYQDLANYCDKAISKVILGTSSTTDEKAFVGSAEVHKNILDMIIDSDRVYVNKCINELLIPKLQLFGVIPQGKVEMKLVSSNSTETEKLLENVKKLKDAGYSVDPNYIQEKVGLPLVNNNNLTQNENI